MVRSGVLAALCSAMLCAATAQAQLASTSSFTFQGRLEDNGRPVNGQRDVRFRVFDASTGGNQISPDNVRTVSVESGLFTAIVNGGVGTFDGSPRFLEVSVRLDRFSPWTTLGPRQPLLPVPAAQSAAGWSPVRSESVDISNLGTGFTLGGPTTVTQTFTPTVSGELQYIDVSFATTSSVTGGSLARILDNGAEVSVGNLLVTPGQGLKRATFTATPVSLVAGRTYSFEFFLPFDGSVRVTGGNGYTGGSLVGQAADRDLAFVVGLRTASTFQHPGGIGIGRAPVPGSTLGVAGTSRFSGPVVMGPIPTGTPAAASSALLVTGPVLGAPVATGVNAGVDGSGNTNVQLAGGTPYIDFSAQAGVDFDGRVIQQGNVMTIQSGIVRVVGAFENLSDERAKQDVRTIDNALSLVSALRGVRYRWKDGLDFAPNLPASEQLGVLAQEVERVLPELVSTAPDGTKSVAYLGLIPVLVEALHEAEARRVDEARAAGETLRQALAQRDQELADLRRRLERLESGATPAKP